jgi:chromosome segregation ATPase
MAFVEAELELSRTSIAKVMSERRDLDVENKMLRNELEDIKAKCDTLEGNKEIMMSEILDLEKIKLRSKVELKTMKEDMEDMKKKFEDTENTQKSMSDDWKVKEEEMQKQLEEMKSRLNHAAEEYQKVYKQNVKLENRIDRIKAKVKVSSDLNFDNYFSFSSISLIIYFLFNRNILTLNRSQSLRQMFRQQNNRN